VGGGHFSMMKVLCELHHLELALAPKGLDYSATYLPPFHFEMTNKTNISALTWLEKYNLFPFVSFLNFQIYIYIILIIIKFKNPQVPVV
jgi:hypothetical protein